jgi:catechol 2,3-dioxygenase-like lactoylglutathione lyase family enzyme
MERVTGIGGIFIRANDPKGLVEWYRDHLGVEPEWETGVCFRWGGDAPAREGMTVWSTFPDDTPYFGPGAQTFMVNYRVGDLDAMLAQLRAAGVPVDEKVDESEFGKFGWATDPEGNRFELWQPPAGS